MTAQENFNKLVSEWDEASMFASNPSVAHHHPSYQRMIGMGPVAVPLILAELVDGDRGGCFWFHALWAITGKEPIPKEHRGYVEKMKQDWIGALS